MYEMEVCFTGHRTIASAELPLLIRRLDETISELIKQGSAKFYSGGAIGFDILAAYAVLKQREQNPLIKLILVLPCKNQDEKWSVADKQMYQQLLNTADEVICLSERYYSGCMEARNRYLVEHSGVCVAYMKHSRSGTSQTVRLATENGLTVINIAQN